MDGNGCELSLPVSCNLNVQRHLDIQQILVLPQVTSHLTLSGPQLILQLGHAVLKTYTAREQHQRSKSTV